MLSFQYVRLVGKKADYIRHKTENVFRIPASCCWIPEKLPKTKTDENNKKKPQKFVYKLKH